MKTVLQVVANYRDMLRAIGGIDNALASVPAGGVRALLDDIDGAVKRFRTGPAMKALKVVSDAAPETISASGDKAVLLVMISADDILSIRAALAELEAE